MKRTGYFLRWVGMAAGMALFTALDDHMPVHDMWCAIYFIAAAQFVNWLLDWIRRPNPKEKLRDPSDD